MKDLHTHILPGMDDGADDVEMSLRMLREEYAQGVRTVALTPHFYPNRESVSSFLGRRALAYDELKSAIADLSEEEKRCLPQMILGAEVAWVPSMGRLHEPEKLCYEGTRYLLLELPFTPWEADTFQQLYGLMSAAAVTPVIAHIDRYWAGQKKEALCALYAMQLPVQLSAETLTHLFSRRRAMKLLRKGYAQMIISDTHDMTDRAPNMAAAAEVLKKSEWCGEVLDPNLERLR